MGINQLILTSITVSHALYAGTFVARFSPRSQSNRIWKRKRQTPENIIQQVKSASERISTSPAVSYLYMNNKRSKTNKLAKLVSRDLFHRPGLLLN